MIEQDSERLVAVFDMINEQLALINERQEKMFNTQRWLNKKQKELCKDLFDLPCDLEIPNGYEDNIEGAYYYIDCEHENLTSEILRNNKEAVLELANKFFKDKASTALSDIDPDYEHNDVQDRDCYTCEDMGLENHGKMYVGYFILDKLVTSKFENIKCIVPVCDSSFSIIFQKTEPHTNFNTEQVAMYCIDALQSLSKEKVKTTRMNLIPILYVGFWREVLLWKESKTDLKMKQDWIKKICTRYKLTRSRLSSSFDDMKKMYILDSEEIYNIKNAILPLE